MSDVFFAHTASHYRLTPLPCGFASLAIISRYSAKRSQFGHFQVCESSLCRNHPPTPTMMNAHCSIQLHWVLGKHEHAARLLVPNNGTLTISTPLWVTPMRGLRNLYLSYPPLSLWVTLVYIHPLQVTLVYFHPLRVTLVYFHPLRVTLVYFHPLRVTLVYFHPLRVTLVYFHPLRVTLVYFTLSG